MDTFWQDYCKKSVISENNVKSWIIVWLECYRVMNCRSLKRTHEYMMMLVCIIWLVLLRYTLIPAVVLCACCCQGVWCAVSCSCVYWPQDQCEPLVQCCGPWHCSCSWHPATRRSPRFASVLLFALKLAVNICCFKYEIDQSTEILSITH